VVTAVTDWEAAGLIAYRPGASVQPAPYQGIQAKLPGGAALWQHAKLPASGGHTGTRRSDMIVVWSDGEVTPYADTAYTSLGTENTLVYPGT
jgi:hypothetical protein